jgi:hypothetical protein
MTYRSHARVAGALALTAVSILLGSGITLLSGEKGEEEGKAAMWGAVAICVLVVGVAGLARGLVFRTRLSVYGNGVLVETLWSSTFARWDDIEAIFEVDPPIERDLFGVDVETYCCGFRRFDGTTFWFHLKRMNNLRDFAARLHRLIDDRIRTTARQALAAGEVVWFGYIGIGRDGVHSRKGVLPWAEVSFAGCAHDTHFEVLKKGSSWGWFSRKLSEVENVTILTELIKSRNEWVLPN